MRSSLKLLFYFLLLLLTLLVLHLAIPPEL